MLEYRQGDLFESEAGALVNPVNCVGVMGKGLAAQFKKRFPEMFKDYKAKCAQGEIKLKEVDTFEEKGKLVVNFPTKGHWRSKSQMEDIEGGLVALRSFLETGAVDSIAIPPLGCGNGGLAWAQVQESIEAHLADIDGVNIIVYAPNYAHTSKAQSETALAVNHFVVAEIASGLTIQRKRMLQKAGYFFNVYAGKPIFAYEPNKYGPYSNQIESYSEDIKAFVGRREISKELLLKEAKRSLLSEAQLRVFEGHRPYIQDACSLVNDYGDQIEALATVYSVLETGPDLMTPKVVDAFFDYSSEKQGRFKPEDVKEALEILKKEGLVAQTMFGWRISPVGPKRRGARAVAQAGVGAKVRVSVDQALLNRVRQLNLLPGANSPEDIVAHALNRLLPKP